MYQQFTKRARAIYGIAGEAASLRNAVLDSEYILLGLMTAGQGIGLMAMQGIMPLIRPSISFYDLLSELKSKLDQKCGEDFPSREDAKLVTKRAIENARIQQSSYIGSDHIICALVGLRNSRAGIFLRDCHVSLRLLEPQIFTIYEQYKNDGVPASEVDDYYLSK